MIAYCGLACDTCPIHKATLEQDPVKRHSMRVAIARVCREQYAMDLQLHDITDCDGCTAQSGRLFSGCAKCEIRACAINRKVASCAYCTDYACDKLMQHFTMDPSAQTRLEALRT